MLPFRLINRFQIYIPVVMTSSSMIVRALFPILGAYFFSQEDYVTAVTLVGILSIAGLTAGLEFHAVIIREFSEKISSIRYRHRAVFKNLATAIPRVFVGSIFLWNLIWPVIDDSVVQPAIGILLLPVIVFLDLLLCEASRIHNASGEFVVGTILTNTKNIGWLFILPFMFWAGFSVVDSILLSYSFSLIVLSSIFTKDFKFLNLFTLPKNLRKNLRRSFIALRGSFFLLEPCNLVVNVLVGCAAVSVNGLELDYQKF